MKGKIYAFLFRKPYRKLRFKIVHHIKQNVWSFGVENAEKYISFWPQGKNFFHPPSPVSTRQTPRRLPYEKRDLSRQDTLENIFLTERINMKNF